MSFFVCVETPHEGVHKISYINEQAWLERSAQAQTQTFCQFNVWHEDHGSFTNSTYTMHTPPGENEYISVIASLFVIYIIYISFTSLTLPPPTPPSAATCSPTIWIAFTFESSSEFPTPATRRFASLKRHDCVNGYTHSYTLCRESKMIPMRQCVVFMKHTNTNNSLTVSYTGNMISCGDQQIWFFRQVKKS